MKSVNKVILLGNLTRDPELRYTEHNKAVCSFGLATNRNWTTETGKKREEPEYHRVVAWEKLAEFCDKYLRKGRKVYVEGRLHTRSFTAKDGTEKAATEIVVEELVLLDPMPDTVREALDFQKPQ
jgi:single-strand DNA-binding protein